MKKETVLQALAQEPSVGIGYRDIMNVMHRMAPKPIYTYSYEFPKKSFDELEELICQNYTKFELNRFKLIHHQKNGNPFYELSLMDNILIEIRDSQDDFVDRSITIYSYLDADNFRIEDEEGLFTLKQELDENFF